MQAILFFILLFLAFVIISLIIEFWRIILGVIVIAVVLGYVKQKRDERQRERQRQREEQEYKRRQEEAEKERREQQEAARIRALENQKLVDYQSLLRYGDKSFALFEAMPKYLSRAEELLDQAEEEFKEGAFVPFWDTVEQAANELGHFEHSVRTINYYAKEYTNLTKKYEETPPPFPLILDSVTGLSVAQTTADRMKFIVRKAQCNYQFAQIYLQRKTNQILIAGFTNLTDAVNNMGNLIDESIYDLGKQVDQMSSTVDQSLRDLGSGLDRTLRSLHKNSLDKIEALRISAQKDSIDRAKRHEQILMELDDIQRNQKIRNP